MAYIIAAEVRVYAYNENLDDVMTLTVAVRAQTEEQARAFGMKLDEAHKAILLANTKPQAVTQ